MHATGYKSEADLYLSIESQEPTEDWESEEALTIQTWISLLAENEGSQVMDTACSKEKFFTMYKRLSCLHTSSTVKPWTREMK